MSLPNPDMDFTAGDVLPASDLDKLVENIESLSDGTGIEDGVITQDKLATGADFATGWNPNALPNVTSVTANGNGSYTLDFDDSVDSVLSEGMRLRTTRTVEAPQTSFSLNGTNQYYSKTSPTGLSFTTTFTCSAWVYLTSYNGALQGIIVRRNADTEGWGLSINETGGVRLSALRIASNNKRIDSYQSIPLNKWVHVAATMDVAAGDTSAQKIWIDGVEVPRSYTIVGTATALVQGTTALVVGAYNSAGTGPFTGYIDQAAVFSSQLSTATIKDLMNQGLTGSETNLVSAFSNGSTTDLNTSNANDLTAQSGATTASVSPFGNSKSSTLDYALAMGVSGSTVTVQTPSGCTIPTTGGVSAVAYSTQANPYGFVSDKGRWAVEVYFFGQTNSTPTNEVWYRPQPIEIVKPTGNFVVGYEVGHRAHGVNTTYVSSFITISTSTTAETNWAATSRVSQDSAGAGALLIILGTTSRSVIYTGANTTLYLLHKTAFANAGNTNGFALLLNKVYALPSGL